MLPRYCAQIASITVSWTIGNVHVHPRSSLHACSPGDVPVHIGSSQDGMPVRKRSLVAGQPAFRMIFVPVGNRPDPCPGLIS